MEEARNAIGADELATSVNEAVERIRIMQAPARVAATPVETGDAAGKPVEPLLAHCAANESMRQDLHDLAKKTADAFGVEWAVIAIIDTRNEYIVGQNQVLPDMAFDQSGLLAIARQDGIGYHVVQRGTPIAIADIQREPSLADHRISTTLHARFYAAAPLMTSDDQVFGALCILDDAPRDITERDQELLERLADEATFLITGQSADATQAPAQGGQETATVGQKVPE
ncbi:GAF domain-containing protein [Pigmentiphaga daeguensis]|jgi:GAF domain-containing protein|uniref:GAF domain-containing protein n=2 Tax=Pigmentiphaga TaxID=152267 RepID=A0ABN1C5S4_9BURK